VAALQTKLQELKMKVSNVTEAIAAVGHSPGLRAQLATIEAEIARLDERLAEMNQPRDLTASLDDLKAFLRERAAAIGELLHGDVEIARQALAKHIDRLVLTSRTSLDGPVLEVSGDVEIFDGHSATKGVCSSDGDQGRYQIAASFPPLLRRCNSGGINSPQSLPQFFQACPCRRLISRS